MEGAWVLLQSRNGVSHAYTTGTGQTNFHQLPSAFSDGGLHFQAGAALINTAAAQGRRSRKSWEQETPSSSSSSRAVTEAIIKDTAG